MNFNRAKSNLQRLTDLKKTAMDDATPLMVSTEKKIIPSVKLLTESLSSVRPTKLAFEYQWGQIQVPT